MSTHNESRRCQKGCWLAGWLPNMYGRQVWVKLEPRRWGGPCWLLTLWVRPLFLLAVLHRRRRPRGWLTLNTGWVADVMDDSDDPSSAAALARPPGCVSRRR